MTVYRTASTSHSERSMTDQWADQVDLTGIEELEEARTVVPSPNPPPIADVPVPPKAPVPAAPEPKSEPSLRMVYADVTRLQKEVARLTSGQAHLEDMLSRFQSIMDQSLGRTEDAMRRVDDRAHRACTRVQVCEDQLGNLRVQLGDMGQQMGIQLSHPKRPPRGTFDRAPPPASHLVQMPPSTERYGRYEYEDTHSDPSSSRAGPRPRGRGRGRGRDAFH